MIKSYENGNAFLDENAGFLRSNPDLACFFFYDAPLLRAADRSNYALRAEVQGDTLLALKVEPYALLLFGASGALPELAEYLLRSGCEVNSYLCAEDVGDRLTEIFGQHGIGYYEALAMDFMEAREKTEETSPRVCRAVPEDIDEIYECTVQFVKDCGLIDPVRRETIEKTLENYRLIREDGRIVSMAKMIKSSDTAYKLSNVYTRPEYRGKGYARLVVNAVKNEILDRNMTATLNVDKKNPVSNHLYQSLGFRKVFSQGEYRRR